MLCCVGENPQKYVDELQTHLQENRLQLQHNTVAAGGGYVCSLVINGVTYGSEGDAYCEIN